MPAQSRRADANGAEKPDVLCEYRDPSQARGDRNVWRRMTDELANGPYLPTE
jgi:hypothetical protein